MFVTARVLRAVVDLCQGGAKDDKLGLKLMRREAV